MNLLLQTNSPDLAVYSRNWGWFFIWGIVLFILGGLAISFTTFSTLLSVVFLGFVIFSCGVVIIIDTFTFWWGKWLGFFLHLVIGALYLAVGVTLINSPMWGSVSLTLFLAIFYIIIGIFRIIYSQSIKSPKWGWALFNGIVSLLLGILILIQWPASSLFIIGLFVGIDLIFSGWGYMMAALGARSLKRA